MKTGLHPWQLLLLILAGWINRQQQDAIEYLLSENRVLKEKLGKKRIRLDDDQRSRLAIKGKILGRKLLEQLAGIVTPDTILRWHRELVARKSDYSQQRQKVGRPPVSKEIVELVLRIARESPSWGYDRIQGALDNLGYCISDTTVGNILRDHGIEPAPERRRQSTWKTFLQAHWDVLASIDFTTIEVWTKSGLATCYLLFVMELATRRGTLCRADSPSGRRVDAPDCEKSHRCRSWISATEAVLIDGPRCKILTGIPGHHGADRS